MKKEITDVIKSEIEDLKDHQQKSYDHLFYSAQRFDLLMVAIASFAILQGIGLVKFIIDKKLKFGIELLWLSIALFATTILCNLISQFMTYQSNKQEYLWSKEKMKRLNFDQSYSKGKEKQYYDLADRYDKANTYLNVISLGSLVFGIVLTIIFLFKFKSII